MAVIRRHPGLCGTLGALLVTLAVIATWLTWSPRSTARADQPQDPLDPVVAGQLNRLRSSAGLDDNALAAANLSDNQLDTLLGGLHDWYNAHADAWNATCTGIAGEQSLIAQCRSAIANGQDQAGPLANHQRQLALLQAQAESQLADLRGAVLGGLSGDQLALLDLMRANPDLSMPFRILNLNAQQRRTLAAVRLTYLQGLAVAQDDQTRQTLADAYAENLAGAVGSDNVALLNSLGAYLPDASIRVTNALNRNLPVQDGG